MRYRFEINKNYVVSKEVNDLKKLLNWLLNWLLTSCQFLLDLKIAEFIILYEIGANISLELKIVRLVVSIDQANPSCFYFRIS